MRSQPAAPIDELRGSQRPRIECVPESPGTAAEEAIELAATAGLNLDPWQAYVLEHALGEREDGRWSATEVAIVVPRQNGKGSVLEARELAGLFLFGEPLIMHTAHEVKTAGEAFLRIKRLIMDSDDFARRVRRVNNTHGEEGIELHASPTIITGSDGRSVRRSVAPRLRFLARSRVAGRGFDGQTIFLDEAFELPDSVVAALLPVMSAQPNPQLWYASTPPNQEKDKNARTLARVRKRARSEDPGRLVYMEWSAVDDPDETGKPLSHEDRKRIRRDPDLWAVANPGLGIRLSAEFTATELGAMDGKDFDVERLGIGDWPVVDDEERWEIIPEPIWRALVDPLAEPVLPVAFAADATPDQAFGSIGVAWRDADGLMHSELTRAADETLDHRPGIGWMVKRLIELKERWDPCALVIDPKRQANAIIPALEAAGVEVVTTSAREMAQACGLFYELATDSRTLRHAGQSEVDAALARATKRDLEGQWAFDGRTGVDISSIVAPTLAVWGHATHAHETDAEPWAAYL